VKATFFMCGHDAELYPDLIRWILGSDNH